MPGMPTFTGGGALTPTVNPTAMNLVQQSMNGGLPQMAGVGQNEELKKQLMKMLMGGGGPLFSMKMGNKGVTIGGSGGSANAGSSAGSMDLMSLLALLQNTNSGQGGRTDPRRAR